MLLKNQKEDTTDYTKDWPARYYDIPTGALRREHLKRAKAEGFAVPADSYREMLCERRFFSEKKDGTVDGFFRAWTMIKASAAAGVSFFQKKRQKKELLTYMKDLCLSPDDLLPESADAVRRVAGFCAGTHLLLHREQSLLFDALWFCADQGCQGGGKARRRDSSGNQGLPGSL